MNTKEIWEKALVYIKSSVNSSVAYNVYIKPVVAVSCDDTVFTVLVNLALSKNMINIRYRSCIENALERVTGKKYTLKIVTKEEEEKKESAPPDTHTHSSDTLNPKYTFESFVVGESNKFAAASAKRATENPGHIYNPLFLYGSSGLGKTHLMHAIGNKIKESNPDYNIIYVPSEKFMNEFVDSLLTNSTISFKNKYRSADVLLIDDVQFLEDKEGLQEEIFHTFNELYARNKQIVLTSDRMPSELIKLQERLRTRFGHGLTFDISIPAFETRVAILKKKAHEHKITIPDDALFYIADKIKTNVRELEGALIKIISMSEISHGQINIAMAHEVVDSLLPNGGNTVITPEKIIEKVAVYYNLTKNEITGKGRSKEIAVPRQVAMYLCSTLTNMNYVKIGKAFGGKDRTTAMHNIKKIENDRKTNQKLDSEINYIIKDIQSL